MEDNKISKINLGAKASIVLNELGGFLEEELKNAEAAVHQQFLSDKNDHVGLACANAVYFAFKNFIIKLEKRVRESNRITKEMLENGNKQPNH